MRRRARALSNDKTMPWTLHGGVRAWWYRSDRLLLAAVVGGVGAGGWAALLSTPAAFDATEGSLCAAGNTYVPSGAVRVL